MSAKKGETDAFVKKGVADAYEAIYAMEKRVSLSETFQSTLEIKFVKSCLKPGLTLDGGCGRGRILSHIANHTGEVVGLDFSRTGVRGAHREFELLGLGDGDFVVGDMERLPFKNNAFSNVVCVGTLEYVLPDMMERIFSEVSRVLEEKGIFCFNCWNATCYYRLLLKLLSKVFNAIVPVRKNVKVSFWSFREMFKALNSIGFRPTHLGAYLFVESWVVDFLKFVPLKILMSMEKTVSNSFMSLYSSSNLWIVATKRLAQSQIKR